MVTAVGETERGAGNLRPSVRVTWSGKAMGSAPAKPHLEAAEVAWIGGRGEELLDDGEKVAQGANGWQGLFRPQGPARDSQVKGLLDKLEGDVSIVELACSHVVVAKDAPEGAW